MSQPARVDFNIWRNADWRQQVTWNDVDLSGSTFEMDVKTTPGDGTAAASATIDDSGAAAGILVLSLPDEALAAGGYHYDLVRINSGERSVLLYGELTVHEGVTQP